jgi:hypothetical protein
MKKILIKDNSFNEGLNVVVTRGVEDAKESEVVIQGLGPRTVETEVVKLSEISDEDIANYHSPHGKVRAGLLNFLRRQYGGNFHEDEQVSVLRFQRRHDAEFPATDEVPAEVESPAVETVAEVESAPEPVEEAVKEETVEEDKEMVTDFDATWKEVEETDEDREYSSDERE